MSLLDTSPRYSGKKAALVIVISFLPTLALFFWLFGKNRSVPIEKIIQTGKLPTEYIAEVLGLSSDCPPPTKKFDCKRGEALLQETALCKNVKISKQKGALFIDYELRKPIGYIGNAPYLAFDEEGIIFSYYPAYFPQKLPRVYLPPPFFCGEKISFDVGSLDEKVTHYDLLSPPEITLQTIYGDILRLEKSTQQLPLYYTLRKEILQARAIVDLRLPDLAFIRELEPQETVEKKL